MAGILNDSNYGPIKGRNLARVCGVRSTQGLRATSTGKGRGGVLCRVLAICSIEFNRCRLLCRCHLCSRSNGTKQQSKVRVNVWIVEGKRVDGIVSSTKLVGMK